MWWTRRSTDSDSAQAVSVLDMEGIFSVEYLILIALEMVVILIHARCETIDGKDS